MLHLGQDDQVAGFQVGACPGICHQVDRLGGIAGEDDLLGGRCIDELRHLFTGLLVHGRGFFRQGMHTPVDVGVVGAVKRFHRFQHRQRFLRGGRGIEIDQRNTRAHFPAQDGKIFTEGENVKRHS